MLYFIAILFAAAAGFGLACWIAGTLLNKSNNIGDSHGDRSQYGALVSFSVKKDRLSKSERDSFSATYVERIDNTASSPSGTEMVRRME